MLQKLNERIQGMVAWLVIILIAITFTLFGVDYYMQAHQTSNAKVIVNDVTLTTQSFETNYRRARSQQDLAQMSAESDKNLQAQVLNQMITNEVMVQTAHKSGFGISSAQANAAIVNIAQFQEDGHFSSERYQQALNAALYTPETFQNQVKQGMLLNQQRFAFMGSSFALPAEIERFVQLYMQTRDYDYLTISAAHLEKQITISQAEIEQYYKQHHKEFLSPEQVSIDYVVLSMRDIRSKIKVSNDDIAKYYNENQNNYLTPAQWQVAHILFAVPDNASDEDIEVIKKKAETVSQDLEKHPEQFDKYLAQSDDKLSIADKGVLPWIAAGQNEYDRILSPLNTVGQITGPVQTKHGFELFKLVGYKPVTSKTLEQMKGTIREQLISDLVQERYTQVLEQLSDLSYQTPDSLKPAADALGLTIQTSKLFSRLGGKDAVTKNKQVVSAAFSHDVLDLNDNSEPIQLDNDSVLVMRINKHIDTKAQTLNEVRAQIKAALLKKAAALKAKELGLQLMQPEKDNREKELMASNDLKWQVIDKASRDADQVNGLINELAFTLPKPGSEEGVSLDNGDYVVVKLKHINDGELSALDKEQQESLIQQIEANYGIIDYDLYVNNMVTNAKIVRP